MELFIYLAKVSACNAAFYLMYHTLFRKLTFFPLNRWYLLSALIVSLVIPLLHIDIKATVPAPELKQVVVNTTQKTVRDVADIAPSITIQQPPHHTDWMHIAIIFYCAIVVLLLLKLVIALGGILYKGIKFGKRANGYRLINGRAANNSSFFYYIFLNADGLDDNEQEQVICHELAHARLMHSADNLFTEVLKRCCGLTRLYTCFRKLCTRRTSLKSTGIWRSNTTQKLTRVCCLNFQIRQGWALATS